MVETILEANKFKATYHKQQEHQKGRKNIKNKGWSKYKDEEDGDDSRKRYRRTKNEVCICCLPDDEGRRVGAEAKPGTDMVNSKLEELPGKTAIEDAQIKGRNNEEEDRKDDDKEEEEEEEEDR